MIKLTLLYSIKIEKTIFILIHNYTCQATLFDFVGTFAKIDYEMLKNTTDIPNELVKEMVEFSRKPLRVRGFDVMIRNRSSRGCSGRAYYCGSGFHCTAKPFITIRIQRRKLDYYYPRIVKARGAYMEFLAYNRLDHIFKVIAHELRHLWQHKNRDRCDRVWGSKGIYSERDADAYAIHMTRLWRQSH